MNGWSSLVNSIGNTNFVAGLAPRAFKASRYCRLIVLVSTPFATEKILSSASENPSARRIAAWRSPSALRIAACFSPSAIVIAACRLPSASVTRARRLRSADIWRVIASCTSLGGVISRISTVVTLTPHRSVTSSSLARRIWLIWSRLASTSSRLMSPMTARSPVVAMPWAAPAKLPTWITLRDGSTTFQ
jgi:hypothetical protein